jgi:ribosomal protein L3
MTRVIHEGKYVPVTLIKVPKLTVAQVKTQEIDGYEALVLEMEDGKKKTLREVPFTGIMTSLSKGDAVSLDMLDEVKEVETVSISKGKSFQ